MREHAFSNLPVFTGAPQTWEAPDFFTYDGMKAFFYEGLPYHGKPTRVFAWMSFPENASPDHPVPGVVLVHGGGGTAFPDWIRLWNDLGFAAIAMDNCGGVPSWREGPHHNPEWPRHEWSGPGGWGVKDINETCLEGQWPFHAIGAVLNAFELLRACPQVDSDRIGVTGISWGGFLTCLAASLEERFRFAIPVYGCGGFDSPMSGLMRSFTPEQRNAWFRAWDPDLYLAKSSVPFLWLTDAEDTAFPLDTWSHSTTLTKNPLTRRSLRFDYVHDHTISWKSKTIPTFAKACLDGTSLPNLSEASLSSKNISCEWTPGDSPLVSADLAYTRANGLWADRRWRLVPAKVEDNKLTADLPPFTTCAYFQIRTADGCLWTSPVSFMV